MNEVRIAIVTDSYMDGVDEERQQIAETFESELRTALDGADVRAITVGAGRGVHQVADKTCDVLILDYGAATFGCHDMGIWQVRDGCKWAEEHPGRVLLIWTSFTQQLYREIEHKYRHLNNVIYHWSESLEHDDMQGPNPAIIKVAQWIGLLED